MSTASAWFVAMSKPRAEALAHQQLLNQDFDVYLPMCPRTVRRRERHLMEISPMFPRYLFARLSRAEQSIASIRSTVGVQQLVRFGVEFAHQYLSFELGRTHLGSFQVWNAYRLGFDMLD